MDNLILEEMLKNLYLKNSRVFFRVISTYNDIKLEWIELFKDNIDWYYITCCSKHCNNEYFLNKYRDYIYWDVLSQNDTITWNSSLYRKLKSIVNLSNNDCLIRIFSKLSFDEKLFEEYIADVDWYCLSFREDVKWTIDFLKKYEEKLNWYELSTNKLLPWSDDLIEMFKNKWLWVTEEHELIGFPAQSILKNTAITWNLKLIEKFSEYISWYEFSSCTNVEWSIELIERFSEKLEWIPLSRNESIPWSIELIEIFSEKLEWVLLSSNVSIPWSEELIFCFINRWDLASIFGNKSFSSLDWANDLKLYIINSVLRDRYIVNYNYLSKVTEITWTDELVERYKTKLNWYYLSLNPSLKLSENFIIENIENFATLVDFIYEDDRMLCSGLSCNENIPWSYNLLKTKSYLWDWRYLSGNNSLPWSIEFINSFKDYWEWSCIKEYKFFNLKNNELICSKWIELPCSLSSNISLPWSIELLESFHNEWDWKELSQNESLPWNEELFDKFYEKWDWNELSINKSIKWNETLISKYINYLNWKCLSSNTSIIWSIELIDRYYNHWDWEEISKNKSVNHNTLLSKKYICKLNFSYVNINWDIELANLYCDYNYNQSTPYSLQKFLQESTNFEIIEEVINELLLGK